MANRQLQETAVPEEWNGKPARSPRVAEPVAFRARLGIGKSRRPTRQGTEFILVLAAHVVEFWQSKRFFSDDSASNAIIVV